MKKKTYFRLLFFYFFLPTQGRIQDFEMGGEFCNNVREIKYDFNFWGTRKKKKERKKGAQKKGG